VEQLRLASTPSLSFEYVGFEDSMYNETCSINYMSWGDVWCPNCVFVWLLAYLLPFQPHLKRNATNSKRYSPYIITIPPTTSSSPPSNFSASFAFLLFNLMESNLSVIIITVVLVSLVIISAVITLIYQLLKHRRLNRAPPPRPMPPPPPWSGIFLPRRPATPVPHDDYAHASRARSPVSSLGEGPEAPLGERKVSTLASLHEGRAKEEWKTYASIELVRVPRVRSEGDEAQNVEFERRVDVANGSKRIFS
jgi:hypothetical protein